MQAPKPIEQNANAAATPFPDRSNSKVAAELAKYPGQYLRADSNTDWQEAATGATLSANKIPPPAKATACGSIVWVWDGTIYSEKSRDCKASCQCVPVKPTITAGFMPVGAEFTKDC